MCEREEEEVEKENNLHRMPVSIGKKKNDLNKPIRTAISLSYQIK